MREPKKIITYVIFGAVFLYFILKRTSFGKNLNISLPSDMDNPAFFIIGIIILVIAGIIFGQIQAKKRREAMQALAQQIGFTFSPDKDRSFASQFGFINEMGKGQNRYAHNILSGVAQDGSHCHVFDYHYETKSRDSKGRTRTNHHHFSIFTLMLPKRFHELTIRPEGLFSKIVQGIGFDDIDFESLEFSKRYEVKSKDKKFAYDFCNAQMIDYLLNQPNYMIEVEGNVLSLIFNGKLRVDEIIPHLESLQQIRARIPQYLLTEQAL